MIPGQYILKNKEDETMLKRFLSYYKPHIKLLILDMLAGRLEIFPMLVLLSRSTWRYR